MILCVRLSVRQPTLRRTDKRTNDILQQYRVMHVGLRGSRGNQPSDAQAAHGVVIANLQL